MPGPLPHPSPRRRNHREPVRVLVADGTVRGPELPAAAPDGGQWCARTKGWWRNWQRSGQARMFTGTDWEALLIAAALHHRMWAGPRPELAGEVRLWCSRLGATPVDRARLRVSVTTTEGDQ